MAIALPSVHRHELLAPGGKMSFRPFSYNLKSWYAGEVKNRMKCAWVSLTQPGKGKSSLADPLPFHSDVQDPHGHPISGQIAAGYQTMMPTPMITAS